MRDNDQRIHDAHPTGATAPAGPTVKDAYETQDGAPACPGSGVAASVDAGGRRLHDDRPAVPVRLAGGAVGEAIAALYRVVDDYTLGWLDDLMVQANLRWRCEQAAKGDPLMVCGYVNDGDAAQCLDCAAARTGDPGQRTVESAAPVVRVEDLNESGVEFHLGADDFLFVSFNGVPVVGADPAGVGWWPDSDEPMERLHPGGTPTSRAVVVEGVTTPAQWRDLEQALGLPAGRLGESVQWPGARRFTAGPLLDGAPRSLLVKWRA
ncbi:hypothetical protein OHQ88_34270 (plasmid) [Micromonospora zamorensis]|uniref:hypothetical protein n=1 Tax=Micromonospora zamorensis TaxID=709883 RepID=UPI002E1F5E91